MIGNNQHRLTSILIFWSLLQLVPESSVCAQANATDAATEDAQRQLAHIIARQRKWKELRDRTATNYKRARRDLLAAQKRWKEAPPQHRHEVSAELERREQALVEAILSAYAMSVVRRAEVIELLHLTLKTPGTERLLDTIDGILRDGRETPANVQNLLSALKSDVLLSRALSDPANRDRAAAFLRQLRENYGEAPNLTGDYSFTNMFELLRRLNNQARDAARQDMGSLMSQYDPEVKLVRERLAVMYLCGKELDAQYLLGFRTSFSGWMRAASPENAIGEYEFALPADQQIAELLQNISARLTARNEQAKNAACGQAGNDAGNPLLRVACQHTSLSGVVLVKLEKRENAAVAAASWRVLEQGTSLNTGDAFTLKKELFAAASALEEGRIAGDELALQTLAQGTVYKQVRESFERVHKAMPVPEPPPCAVCPEPPVVDVSPTRNPSALWAVAWSGAPWLMDDQRTNDGVGYALGAADVILAVGGVVLGGVAIVAHKSEWQSDSTLLTAASIVLSADVIVRGASGVAFTLAAREKPPTEQSAQARLSSRALARRAP